LGPKRLLTIGTRLLRLVFVMFLVSTGTFFLLQLVPGDPAAAALGPGATPQDYEQVRSLLGLNKPLGERYLDYYSQLLHGNLGQSLFPPHQDVSHELLHRAPVTIELALLSLTVALSLAIPIAMWAAARPNSYIDRFFTGTSFGFISIPSFLSGLLLVFIAVFHPGVAKTVVALIFVWAAVAVARPPIARLRSGHPMTRTTFFLPSLAAAVLLGLAAVSYFLFPAFDTQGFSPFKLQDLGPNIKSLTLPVLALAFTQAAIFIRVLRSDLLHTLGEDYILAARAKGMPAWHILARDALRPSLVSLVTVASVSLGQLIGGSVIIESLFNLPGLGNLVFSAVLRKNFPVVQACVLMIATVYIVINLLVDIAYGRLDPRVRRGA